MISKAGATSVIGESTNRIVPPGTMAFRRKLSWSLESASVLASVQENRRSVLSSVAVSASTSAGFWLPVLVSNSAASL